MLNHRKGNTRACIIIRKLYLLMRVGCLHLSKGTVHVSLVAHVAAHVAHLRLLAAAWLCQPLPHQLCLSAPVPSHQLSMCRVR